MMCSPRAAATIAAALLGLCACTGGATDSAATGSASPTPDVTAGDWTTGLDSQPTQAVADGDRVFVSTAGSARFPPQVYGIDSASGQEVASHTATGQPYDLLVAPDGRLWIAGDRHPDQAGGAGINVHDPASLLVVDHADLPGQAYSLAVVGNEIWVGSDDAVLALEPTTLELLRTVPIGGPAYDLLVLPGGGGVIAVEGDQLELLQPDGSVVAVQPVDADGSIVAAATAATVLVRVPAGADSTMLAVAPSLASAGTPLGVDTDSVGGGLLADADGDVVLVDDRRDEVLCLSDGAPPPASIPAPDLVSVLADLGDGRLIFATSTGVAVRAIPC